MGRVEAASADYEQAAKAGDKSGVPYAALGNIRLAAKQYEKAREEFTRAIDAGLKTASIHVGRARAGGSR